MYHARYYRLKAESGKSLFGILGTGARLDRVAIIGFPGDHDTYGLGFFTTPDDEDLKIVRQDWAWDAVFAAIPGLAALGPTPTSAHADECAVHGRPSEHPLAPRCRWRTPRSRTAACGRFAVHDQPDVRVGCVDGAHLHEFAAVDAAMSHAGDLGAVDDGIRRRRARQRPTACTASPSAMDRVRSYEWSGEGVPGNGSAPRSSART